MIGKKELANVVSEEMQITKAAAKNAVNGVFSALTNVILENQDETLSIRDFGNFKCSVRPARKGRNPHSGAEIDIPETMSLKFKVAKSLKEKLNA